MGNNFLIDSLGINGYNYNNREYILATSARILDNISMEKLENVIRRIIKDSNIFNFTFNVTENGKFELTKKKFSDVNVKKVFIENDEREKFEKELTDKEMQLQPGGYLYKFIISENKYKSITMYFLAHHSIMDGLAMYNLLNNLYEGLNGIERTEVDDSNEYNVSERIIEKNKKFWADKREKFGDLIKSKNLEELGGETIDFTKEEVSKIKMSNKGIMNTSLLGIIRSYAVYYPDDYSRFAIDFAVNLRSKKNSKSYGMFVNILPMFFEDIYNKSIGEVYKKLKGELIGTLRNCSSSPVEVGETYSNIMYSYIPMEKLIDDDLENHIDGKWMETGTGPYDFAFTVFEGKESICIRADYKKSLYSADEVKTYLGMLKKYILDYIEYSEEEIEKIPFTHCTFTDDYLEHQLKVNNRKESFEKLLDISFKNNLSRNVVITDNDSITYRRMLKNVFYYAEKMKEQIEEKNPEVIFIYGDPTIESFVMMITAIYVGIPYMFLSAKIPEATILNLNKEFRNLFFANEKTDLVEYMQFPELLDGEDLELDLDKDIFVKTNRVATYFCTSGTTGEPKIIPVKRAGLCNLINNESNSFIGENDTSLLLSSVTFDLTEDPIYRTFLKGGTLVVIDIEKIFNEEYLLNCVVKNNVDTVLGTPSALSGISDKVYANLKKVGSVGEALSRKLADRLNSFNNLRVFNCYGPTEATCYCHLIEITGNKYSDTDIEVPIGQIIDGMKSYVVDPFGTVLPNGIKGELILSGTGVLDNYHNYKGKDNVFLYIDGEKYYKSGDICCFDGENYYYMNRKGRQVKINGYRVELSAIEEKIQTFFDRPFKVIVVNSILVLFHEEEVDSNKVIQQAELLLPNYMIPRKFFKVDNLPMNKNQKVDVRMLNKIYNEYISMKSDEKLTPTQKVVYDAFAEVLGISNFLIDDELYALGGNSLMAIRISNKLQENYSYVEFDTIMKHQSVRNLADYIDKSSAEGQQFEFTGEFKTEYEPTGMQTSMIIKQLRQPNDTTYIIGSLVEVNDENIEMDRLKLYINSKKDFHFNVKYEKGKFFMNYNNNFQIREKRFDLENIAEIVEKIEPFNIFKDSLIRISHVYIKGKRKYMLFEMHHLISDGMSIVKLLHDVYSHNRNYEKEIYFSEAKDYILYKYNKINDVDKNEFIKSLKENKTSIFDNNKKSHKTFKKIIILSENENNNVFKFKKDNSISVQALLSSVIMRAMKNLDIIEESNSYVIGTPVNLRDSMKLMNTMGPMINMIPFVVSCAGEEEDYQKTQNNLNYSISNKFIPYADIVEQNNDNEMFNIVITSFENYEMPEGIKMKEDIILYPEKFGCTIHIYEEVSDIKIVITSNVIDDEKLALLEKSIKDILINLGGN